MALFAIHVEFATWMVSENYVPLNYNIQFFWSRLTQFSLKWNWLKFYEGNFFLCMMKRSINLLETLLWLAGLGRFKFLPLPESCNNWRMLTKMQQKKNRSCEEKRQTCLHLWASLRFMYNISKHYNYIKASVMTACRFQQV